MRKIGIRKFHQNMWEEVEDLPFIVTRRGKPSFMVDAVPSGTEPKEVVFEDLGTCSWDKTYKCKSPAVTKVRGKAYCELHAG